MFQTDLSVTINWATSTLTCWQERKWGAAPSINSEGTEHSVLNKTYGHLSQLCGCSNRQPFLHVSLALVLMCLAGKTWKGGEGGVMRERFLHGISRHHRWPIQTQTDMCCIAEHIDFSKYNYFMQLLSFYALRKVASLLIFFLSFEGWCSGLFSC